MRTRRSGRFLQGHLHMTRMYTATIMNMGMGMTAGSIPVAAVAMTVAAMGMDAESRNSEERDIRQWN